MAAVASFIKRNLFVHHHPAPIPTDGSPMVASIGVSSASVTGTVGQPDPTLPTVTGKDAAGNVVTGFTPVWSSANPDVAVPQGPNVHVVAPGTTTFTVQVGALSLNVTVTVQAAGGGPTGDTTPAIPVSIQRPVGSTAPDSGATAFGAVLLPKNYTSNASIDTNASLWLVDGSGNPTTEVPAYIASRGFSHYTSGVAAGALGPFVVSNAVNFGTGVNTLDAVIRFDVVPQQRLTTQPALVYWQASSSATVPAAGIIQKQLQPLLDHVIPLGLASDSAAQDITLGGARIREFGWLIARVMNTCGHVSGGNPSGDPGYWPGTPCTPTMGWNVGALTADGGQSYGFTRWLWALYGRTGDPTYWFLAHGAAKYVLAYDQKNFGTGTALLNAGWSEFNTETTYGPIGYFLTNEPDFLNVTLGYGNTVTSSLAYNEYGSLRWHWRNFDLVPWMARLNLPYARNGTNFLTGNINYVCAKLGYHTPSAALQKLSPAIDAQVSATWSNQTQPATPLAQARLHGAFVMGLINAYTDPASGSPPMTYDDTIQLASPTGCQVSATTKLGLGMTPWRWGACMSAAILAEQTVGPFTSNPANTGTPTTQPTIHANATYMTTHTLTGETDGQRELWREMWMKNHLVPGTTRPAVTVPYGTSLTVPGFGYFPTKGALPDPANGNFLFDPNCDFELNGLWQPPLWWLADPNGGGAGLSTTERAEWVRTALAAGRSTCNGGFYWGMSMKMALDSTLFGLAGVRFLSDGLATRAGSDVAALVGVPARTDMAAYPALRTALNMPAPTIAPTRLYDALGLDCTATITGVTYTSDTPGVVAVNSTGILSFVAPGTARITRITTASTGQTVTEVMRVDVLATLAGALSGWTVRGNAPTAVTFDSSGNIVTFTVPATNGSYCELVSPPVDCSLAGRMIRAAIRQAGSQYVYLAVEAPANPACPSPHAIGHRTNQYPLNTNYTAAYNESYTPGAAPTANSVSYHGSGGIGRLDATGGMFCLTRGPGNLAAVEANVSCVTLSRDGGLTASPHDTNDNSYNYNFNWYDDWYGYSGSRVSYQDETKVQFVIGCAQPYNGSATATPSTVAAVVTAI